MSPAPPNHRRVAIAIGVANAPPLPFLSGAVNGARAFHAWTSGFGYESTLLIDDETDVTLARLRSAIDAILAVGKPPIHRFLLYFAGHGLIREAEEGLWLLSDWFNEMQAVAVEGLRRRLYMHDIRQIAIFADSCRSLPKDIDDAQLLPHPVLGRGPFRGQTTPAIDKFIAAQDGFTTFMIPGDTPDEDRCLFSGLLMEGLWGSHPAAFSRLLPGKITSRSLGAWLQKEVPELAERYHRKLFPNVSPSFPEDDDIYFGDGTHPVTPAFPPWPPLDKIALPAARGFGFIPLPSETRLLAETSEISGLPGGEPWEWPPIRRSPAMIHRKLQRVRPPHRYSAPGEGFAMERGSVRRYWTPQSVFAEAVPGENWWRIAARPGGPLSIAVPVLIEFDDGVFAAVTALPEFIASIHRDEKGVSALIYRERYSECDTSLAESTIAGMRTEALRSEALTGLAASLRQLRHVDPILGVISAYLYDSIGDTDNIRRMAYYYTDHSQPIPFDIALLARLNGEWRDGSLWTHVPSVAARQPRTDAEKENPWTCAATPQSFGQVAGLWPWMRQGWTYLDEGSDLIAPGLTQLTGNLLPARFTTMNAEGGHKLAELFHLRP